MQNNNTKQERELLDFLSKELNTVLVDYPVDYGNETINCVVKRMNEAIEEASVQEGTEELITVRLVTRLVINAFTRITAMTGLVDRYELTRRVLEKLFSERTNKFFNHDQNGWELLIKWWLSVGVFKVVGPGERPSWLQGLAITLKNDPVIHTLSKKLIINNSVKEDVLQEFAHQELLPIIHSVIIEDYWLSELLQECDYSPTTAIIQRIKDDLFTNGSEKLTVRPIDKLTTTQFAELQSELLKRELPSDERDLVLQAMKDYWNKPFDKEGPDFMNNYYETMIVSTSMNSGGSTIDFELRLDELTEDELTRLVNLIKSIDQWEDDEELVWFYEKKKKEFSQAKKKQNKKKRQS